MSKLDINRDHVEIDLLGKLESLGINMDELKKATVKHAFRHIKRRLIQKSKEENRNIIMVVSANPAEGKTFVACNLAISLATEIEKEVLLIDADIARSSVSDFFGIDKSRRGFVEYLKGDTALDDVLIHTNKKNFDILPVGKMHDDSTELLSSNRTRQIVQNLASNNQSDKMIIIDSPPLFATSDAMALSELADQIVVVVESGGRPRDIKEALKMLDASRVSGTVLNKTSKQSIPYYYGYGYGVQ